MSYKRFSELWDALITNNPRLTNRNQADLRPETKMNQATLDYLIKRSEKEDLMPL